MTRPKLSHLLLPFLVLGMAVATVSTVRAQSRYDQGSSGMSGSLQITFGSTPRWTSMRGTRVMRIRDRERPDYDMFRYGNVYYIYRDDHWYSSRRVRGSYRMVEDRYVPMQVSGVPREHWRAYPNGWMERNNRHRGDDNNGNRRYRGGNNGNGNGRGNR
jgi:hypothetical protein